MNRATGQTLTLLFTDFVSSTELSARLGSDAHALRRAHDRILREQFDAHGGNVVKNTGDGFFATFPSARQAVECAAAIQATIAQQKAEGRYPDLAVRIGLHTGEPVLEDGDYFGLDVALASRIMDEASGGEVLLSDITYLLARSATPLRFDAEGARDLKGVPEPVALYRLRWDLQAQPSHLSRFVGRAGERSRLAARLDGALQGRGSLVFISGDGGLGKTRLANELCLEARDRGMLVLTGRAFSTEGQLPYHVVTDALRAHLRGRPAGDVRALLQDDAAFLAKVVPELRDLLPGLATPIALTPEAERYRLFEAIAGTLTRLVEAAPGVLFLDDLHWADRATAHLVEHLAQRVTGVPLLVLATYRDAELSDDHPLTALAFEVERRAVGERVALGPLSRDDAAALAAQVLGAPLPEDVADALYAAAEGNPFFTEELVRHMRDHAGAGRGPAWEVPDSVRHVLLRRLDGLSEQTRDLLACCAVMGRDLTSPRIAAVTGMPDEDVIDALDEALEARVFREERDGYSFAHPLIREAVYQSLSAPRRQLAHRRVATGLERLYHPDVESHAQELAHHFLESAKGGTDVATAIEYARRAAAQATAVFAYHEAAAYYRRAADAVASSRPTSVERCELLLSLGEMLTKAGDAPGADATFHLAAGVARALGRGDLLSRAALGLGDVRRTGGIVDEPLIQLLHDALAALDPGDSVLRARVLARLTSAQYLTRSFEQLRAQAKEAVDMAERLGDDATRVYVWCTIRLFKKDQHDAAGRLDDARALESLAVRVGDREAALYARHMQIDTLVELGDIPAADAMIAAFEQEAETLRQPFYLWLGAVYRAMRALLDGRWAEAEELAQAAFEMGREAQTETNLAVQFLAAQLFAVRLEQGRLSELVPVIRNFAGQYPAVRWRVGLAFALSESGDDAAARDEFESIVKPDYVDVPGDFNQSMLHVFLAELCERFDDRRRAQLVYERLLPFAGRTVVVGAPATCAGAASRLLGLLAGMLERWDDAERHFEEALAMNARLGSRPLVAWTKFAYASTLRRRGQPGDEERAARLLNEASMTAEEFGMVRLAERIGALAPGAVPGG